MRRVQRRAHVVQDVDAQQLRFARQRVDRDLGDRGAMQRSRRTGRPVIVTLSQKIFGVR